MSNVLTHRFTSPKLDGPDASQVQPSAWNDGHHFTGGTAGQFLTRDPSDAAYGATWTTPAPPTGWVPYTPSWYQDGALVPNPAPHTLTGAWYRAGNAVWFRLLFVVGGGLGGSYWYFGLPVPCTSTVTPGQGLLYTPDYRSTPLWFVTQGQATFGIPMYLTAPGVLAFLTGSTPIVLAAGMAFEIRGNYEAAP